jgi:hypothetical protein
VDFEAMESLYDKGHHVWALFVAYLVIVKLLKAHYVRNVDNNPPLITRSKNKVGLPLIG